LDPDSINKSNISSNDVPYESAINPDVSAANIFIDNVETICTTYDVSSVGSDYIKVDAGGVDADEVNIDTININNEIKIKKLEEDIKNIVDDRIKLLTVIDTITKENRTMYRHIQNSSKSWFSRIFN
jgi:hypothetical protein